VDVRKVDLRESFKARMGAANKTATKKSCATSAPASRYKLRDAAGQAREFNNYMLPWTWATGCPVFLTGYARHAGPNVPLFARAGRRKGSMDGSCA
jgi:cytochrome c biogenesis protein